MNKAKAMFAAGVIVVVAAASGALWYLNENGKLGNDADEIENASAYVQEEDDYQPDKEDKDYDDNDNQQNDGSDNEEKTTSASGVETPDYDVNKKDDVDEMLSACAKFYFAEDKGVFDKSNYSDYDLMRFAFMFVKTNSRDVVAEMNRDDSVGCYMGVPYGSVNSVIEELFGITIERESIYTENDYEFFMYEDGYFYTPAADGVGFTNTCEIDSFDINGDMWTVQFTIYDGSTKYATGEARVRDTETGMKVEYYRVYL